MTESPTCPAGQGHAAPAGARRATGPDVRARQGPAILRLWRVVPATGLRPATAEALLATLRTCAPPTRHRSWGEALDGDAAALTRVAVTVLRVCGPESRLTDLVASALLAQALRGEPAAAALLAHALRRLGERRPREPHLARLAASWDAWAPPPGDRAPGAAAGAPARAAPEGRGDRSRPPAGKERGLRLWILSDLHRDVGLPWTPAEIPDADVAVVAGDVREGLVESVTWLAHVIRPHMPVVCVAGNHEFYRRTFVEELARGRAVAANLGVHLLEDDTVVIGGVPFSGCTLWTDYDLDGPDLRAASMEDARRGMNDHRLISFQTKPRWMRFRPEEALAVHRASRAYLEGALAAPAAAPRRPHVVVTHHAPSARSVAPAFRGKPLNPAFASRLDAFVEQAGPTLWVHGHTHASMDYRLGETRVLCNPKGYGGENPAFDPALVVEV